jgi:hypothetical protein
LGNTYRKGSGDRKLGIPPLKIPGKVTKIPVSKIKMGYKKTINMPKAVVAYFDVLGFSRKKSAKDIELTLQDFSAPLAIASTMYPHIRFNVFSDCAFLAAPLEQAKELLSSIRFAFTQWTSDGILVRGGIALGKYSESRSVALEMTLKNFAGNLFAGSGVVGSVKLENSGCGALLFTDKKCSEFYKRQFGEPVFSLENLRILGWSDDEGILYWFVGISLLRLLKVLSLDTWKEYPATRHLVNNIKYSLGATNSYFLYFLVLAILSLPTVSSEARKKAIQLFNIKDPEDFIPCKKLIDEWLKSTKKFRLLSWFADSDTSIP